MANQTAGYTLIEMAKNIAPDGTQMTIAMTLAKEMAMLLDIPWFPSNGIWDHRSQRSAKLPAGTWRAINEHITPGVALTDDIQDVIGIVEDFAVYDKLWIDRQPDPGAARMGRAKMYLEGIAQTIVSAFLYGNNAVTPKQPHGFMPRLASTGRYVIDNGGSTARTSALVITWGEGATYGVYPKHGQAPEGDFLVQHADLGERVDVAGTVGLGATKLRVYEDNFKFEGGLVNEDPRCTGRLANINSTIGGAGSFDKDNLITLIDRMKINESTVIYVNENLISQMRIAMNAKNNVQFTPGKGAGLFGEPVLFFDEIPIRKIDSAIFLNTEDAVS